MLATSWELSGALGGDLGSPLGGPLHRAAWASSQHGHWSEQGGGQRASWERRYKSQITMGLVDPGRIVAGIPVKRGSLCKVLSRGATEPGLVLLKAHAGGCAENRL